MAPGAIGPPGEHGGDAGAVAGSLGIERSDLIDLSMSMNPFAPDVEAVLSTRLRSIADYPDASPATVAVAEAIGVDHQRLVLTNGGAEAIALVAALQPTGRVVEPEFSLYRRHLADVDDASPRWRSNPSNPLGKLTGPADDTDSGGPAVWDEAFYPLATGEWTDRRLHDRAVWRIGSLTKLWSCPGLRIGYAIAPDDRGAHALRRRQPQWSVNGLALAAIPALLDATDLVEWSSSVRTLRLQFAAALRGLGFSVIDTDTNWVLVDDHPSLRGEMVSQGVLVRDCSSFGLAQVSRVALPRPYEIDHVVGAFSAVADAR